LNRNNENQKSNNFKISRQ